MATLATEDLVDLGITTLKQLGRGKWSDISTTLQKFVAMPQMMKKNKVVFDDGKSIQWNIQTGTSSAAKAIGMFNVDNYLVTDTMTTAEVNWRHYTTNYEIARQEVTMNGGASKIVDLYKTRRHAALVAQARLFEEHFWSKPADSTDKLKLYGIFYWLVYSATTGFNGGNPAGFSAGAGGLSTLTVPNWANWTDQYVNVTKPDLIAKIRLALYKTNWISPVDYPANMRDMDMALYTNYNVMNVFETLAENQNENLGPDIAKYDGMVVIKRHPIMAVPQLDTGTPATANPVIGIDWGAFQIAFLRGEYMNESKPRIVPNMHTVTVVDIDNTLNTYCSNRRSQFLIAKSDPAA